MATRIQFRRGTSAQHASFTGAVGEMTVDTDKDVVVVHDGSTAGGFEMLKSNLSNLDISGTDGSGKVILSDGDGTYTYGQIDQNFVKRTTIFNNTRYAHSNATDRGNVWSGTFTKVYDSDTSAIFLTWMAKSYATNSDFSGVYFDINTGTTHGTDNSDAFYGVGYTDNGEQAVHWGHKRVDRSSVDAGSHTVIWGWRTRAGVSANRPGNVLNPNSSDDNRMHNSGFYCFIDEILK